MHTSSHAIIISISSDITTTTYYTAAHLFHPLFKCFSTLGYCMSINFTQSQPYIHWIFFHVI